MALDPYDQLGVERTATAAEIKSAWRSKAQKMHPDKNQDDPFAGTRYELLRESFEILSDPTRRSAYDKDGKTEIDNLPQRAQALLEQVALGLLDQAEKGGVLGEIDIVKSLTYALKRMRTDCEHAIVLSRRRMLGIEKQLKRVRRKNKGENVLTALMAVRLDKARDERKRMEQSLEEFGAALALLADYEDIDLLQRQLASSSSSSTSTVNFHHSGRSPRQEKPT